MVMRANWTGQASDAALVERYSDGDRGALEALIHRHQAKSYRYAFRLTRDVDRAVDVVAEAFVELARSIPRLRRENTFTILLYKALTSCYLESAERGAAKALSMSPPLRRGLESQVDYLDRLEREVEAHDSVSGLPEYEQAMLTLFHAEMLSYTEISEIFELPPGTVRRRINVARQELLTGSEGRANVLEAPLAVA